MRYISLFIIMVFAWFPLTAQTILPTPQSTSMLPGNFAFDNKVKILIKNRNSYVLDYLKNVLKETGSAISATSNSKKAEILFVTDPAIENEGYTLNISPRQILIKASGDAGFFYALQSVSQLMQSGNGRAIPCVSITDAPRYRLRSFLLDSGRQFQSIETIKKYLDMMAMLKMNTFHWHLTEGLGWRLEIKKYPELTKTGAFISNGKEQQGFYSQKDVKEIIKYAADRNITVMPEIDMPGHAEAALISYPQFSCFGDTIRVSETSGFTKNIFCAGKPATMQFLKDVLDEVCELFPSVYIHVGGDEAPKGNWDVCPDCQGVIKSKGLSDSGELQLYFSSQIANHLKSKGRKAVLWEDVLYTKGYKLPDNVVVHWWNFRSHKEEGLTEAIRRGHEVICGTNNYTYLNFPLTPWKGYKQNRTFDIRDIYEKNPSMKRDDNPLVIGMSAALWTDYTVTQSMIDRRLFPRIFALSEQMWHKGQSLPFDTFYKIVQEKRGVFEGKGYDFGPGLKAEVSAGYSWD